MSIIAIAALIAIPPNYTPTDLWNHHWQHEIQQAGALTPQLVDDYRHHHHTLNPPQPAQPIRPRAIIGVQRWRTLIEAHFHPDHIDEALTVMWCESRGNPDAANPHSTARGLFQFLKGWWGGAWGYPAFNPYNPEANIRAAAWLSDRGADWTHWQCKP